MTELLDWALTFGPLPFIMVWCYVDGHVREWHGEDLKREDFDIFEHRKY
jgi:hypothetical protein